MSEAFAKWTAAFVKAQAAMPHIHKGTTAKIPTRDGKSFSYSYAELPDIIDAVRPVLTENGLGIGQSVEPVGNGIGLFTRIYHEAGHVETFGPVVLPAGGDARAAGSAITYARRYGLCAALNIAADEDDDGAQVSAGSTAPTGKTSAAPVAPQPEVSANSWAEEETEGSAASQESRPSSSSWDELIQMFGRDVVWQTAKATAKDLKDGLVPIKPEMLDKCSPRVFAAVAEILATKAERQPQSLPAEAANA